MATLQTSGQSSAFTARSRLKHVLHDQVMPQTTKIEPVAKTIVGDTIAAPMVATPETVLAASQNQRLTELDQRHLLLQAVTVYAGWYLVSVQHRSETDALVAYLVRSGDQTDPGAAIQAGRAMQIIMDSVGDLKVQYGRQGNQPWWFAWFGKLKALFAGSD